jgi:hypothetical protein
MKQGEIRDRPLPRRYAGSLPGISRLGARTANRQQNAQTGQKQSHFPDHFLFPSILFFFRF